MRKVRQMIARLLLLCMMGGVLSPTLNVHAAGTIQSEVCKVNGLNFTYLHGASRKQDDFNEGTDQLGLAYTANQMDTVEDYVDQLNQSDDVSGLTNVGNSSGCIEDYIYRTMINAYALHKMPEYKDNGSGTYPNLDCVPSDASYSFDVNGESYNVQGSLISFFGTIDSSAAFNQLYPTWPGTDYSVMSGAFGWACQDVFQDYNDGLVKYPVEPAVKVIGAANCNIAEFYVYATKYREEVDKDQSYQTDTNVQSTLATLKALVGTAGHYYPIMEALWEYKPSTDADAKSLKEMCEEADIDYTPGVGLEFDTNAGYSEVGDKDNPLHQFYIINSENGIARIDRTAVLNNIVVDESLAEQVTSFLDDYNGLNGKPSQRDPNNANIDGLIKDGTFDTGFGLPTEETAEEDTEEGEDSDEEGDLKIPSPHDIISGGVAQLSLISADEIGVDVEGTAINTNAVALSSYITEGMAYSATFVPMKTNLYSPDTLAQFDQEFRDEFYYKYGFMRKALLWDSSGSAAMDYYNANGKCTSTLRVVTLRDLLESGDNDIALYVDSDFYNAAECIEQANEVLKSRNLTMSNLTNYLSDYCNSLQIYQEILDSQEEGVTLPDVLSAINSPFRTIVNAIANANKADDATEAIEETYNAVSREVFDTYNYRIENTNINDTSEEVSKMQQAVLNTSNSTVDEHTLKTGKFSLYSNATEALLTEITDTEFKLPAKENQVLNDDNYDSIVLPSSLINTYMYAKSSYQNRIYKDEDGQVIVNKYESYDDYTPMLSFAYVSALYREGNYYSLANLVTSDTPVFLASDDICGIDDANQWYCNTILNYAFVKNLKSAAQVDYTYTVDLDCPLYIDVFGNILTESGIVVIPAACNATLHTAAFKDANVAVGLYAIYGKDYYVPIECVGAAKSLFPFFVVDKSEGVYIVNGSVINLGSEEVTYNEITPYDASTQKVVMEAYRNTICSDTHTSLNWIAMVNTINEVMRGAPIENIDKATEGLDVVVERNKAAIVAAVKLEALIDSLDGMMQNTLIAIPDFSRMDATEYLVAFLIKVLIVLTTAVIIITIYNDGVSGQLGLRTFWKSMAAVTLTFSAVCVVPAIFQLTYYAANKALLQDEAFKILMLNTEKYQSGVEIGMLEAYTPEDNTDMAIQLDWISVPWYDQLENMLYGSTLTNLREVKQKAYLQSPVYNNYDVTLHDDGVYVTTQDLFAGVNIDYTFNDVSQVADTSEEDSASTIAAVNGLYLYSNNDVQTASFYSPYYAFLTVLTANINEYNYYHDTYNYTTKYMSGNRIKTVGLCNTYFTSKSFMELDSDIMHIREIYGLEDVGTLDHGLVFTPEDVERFSSSYWYNNLTPESLAKRIDLMNTYARDFVADNKDMLMKISDETFIKVMALNLAIKYNQLFGIPTANALEIYNMDSNDLLRLSIALPDEAVLSSPMSYARFVYNFGGEPAVYAAAVLTVIMWVGSFIKPLCTIITFCSVFASIFVFRVVLRKPSANLWGYFITCTLLCATNILHALVLKVSIKLPSMGLSVLGCLLFIIVGQVSYLLILGYVTGVSLKDWTNLGFTEYDREAKKVKSKLGSQKIAQAELSGRLPHHEDNWEYYNDLVKQHRDRNIS